MAGPLFTLKEEKKILSKNKTSSCSYLPLWALKGHFFSFSLSSLVPLEEFYPVGPDMAQYTLLIPLL
jgi:hypothetical protein